MDIFTDASLNDKKKIAGIGVVFVWPTQPVNIQRINGYLLTDNIETAELSAISEAVARIAPFHPQSVRLFSDSEGALRKLQRIFHHPTQNQIQTIANPVQKDILYDISASFRMMLDVDFSFYRIKGHQRKPAEFTEAYYNMLADQEASSARLLAEMLLKPNDNPKIKKVVTGQGVFYPTRSWIVSPSNISFHYDEDKKEPKVISKHTKKEGIFRRAKRTSSQRIYG